MSIEKTYSITVKYSREDEGLVYERNGVKTTQGELSEDNIGYKGVRQGILDKIAGVVPIQAGNISAHIVGSVSES